MPQQTPDSNVAPTRETYQTPTLRDHGSVADVTLAGGNSTGAFDGNGYQGAADPASTF